MRADGEHRNAAQFVAPLMAGNGAHRVGAGHQDGRPRAGAEFGIRQNLDGEQRRDDRLVTAGAQRCGGARGVGFGAREQDPHRLTPLEKAGAGAAFEFAAGIGAERRRIATAALA